MIYRINSDYYVKVGSKYIKLSMQVDKKGELIMTPTKEKITLVPTGQQIPNDYVLVGTCTYGESGFTPTEICTYEAITRTAMEDARNIGATIVYVTKVKEPSFGSSCYTITVHFYKKKE